MNLQELDKRITEGRRDTPSSRPINHIYLSRDRYVSLRAEAPAGAVVDDQHGRYYRGIRLIIFEADEIESLRDDTKGPLEEGFCVD